MNLHVLLPVKPFSIGKSRLAAVLDPAERASLNRRLFAHVLGTVRLALPDTPIHVVSSSRDVLALAGPAALRETGRGLCDALAQARDHAVTRGAQAILTISSDLPLLGAADVRILAGAISAAQVVVATDGDGRGTNALALRPPDAIPFLFGKDSRARHVAAARAANLPCRCLERPGLAGDLDEPADFVRLSRQVDWLAGLTRPASPHPRYDASNSGEHDDG